MNSVTEGVVEVRGYCNRCGVCCKFPQFQTKQMLNEDGTQCKYVSFKEGVSTCRITAGLHSDNIPSKPDWVPKRDYEFWLKHCKPFPRVGDLGHHKPPNCSFYRVYVKPNGEEVKLD